MTGRRLRDSATLGAGVISLALVLAPPGHALDDCGVGMYYNNYNGQCEPWAPVGVNFAPAVPVPVVDPVPIGIGFDPVPLGIGFDPGFGLNIPNVAPYLRVPGVPGIPGIPGVHVPGVPGIPGVHVPGVPGVHVPDVRAPDVRVPEVRAPEVRAPEVRAPEIHPRR
jgi:hypothetical protein